MHLQPTNCIIAFLKQALLYNSFIWHEMKAKTFRDIFLYLLLLAPALLFVKNYVADYMDGDTIFVQTREDVTVDDIPTITICTGYTYHHCT